MNIYEITFLLVTYLSLGANSWLRAVLHRFSQEPLEGRGRVFYRAADGSARRILV